MSRRRTRGNPLFSRRRFADEVIILCVRWYLRFKLSYREMAEIAWELDVLVAPSTILRWVVRYAEDFSRLWRQFERSVGRSWRCDKTYIEVGGRWRYLYRCGRRNRPYGGITSQSHAGRYRGQRIFREALKARHERSDSTASNRVTLHCAEWACATNSLPLARSGKD